MLNYNSREVVTFFESVNDEFLDFLSNINRYLYDTDSKYKDYADKNKKILKENPSLNLDNLKNEDAKKYDEFKANLIALNYIKDTEIFFRGFKEAYFYFKRCNLLKEDAE